MKKAFIIFLVYLFSACCGDNVSNYETTIITTKSKIIKFVENELPTIENVKRDSLGITIEADEIDRIMVKNLNFGNKLYACQDENFEFYQNFITEINIFTIYNFNEDFAANNNVNDIVKKTYYRGDNIIDSADINTLTIESLDYFKFTSLPTFDTLQFKITGSLSNTEDVFEIFTQKIVLEE